MNFIASLLLNFRTLGFLLVFGGGFIVGASVMDRMHLASPQRAGVVQQIVEPSEPTEPLDWRTEDGEGVNPLHTDEQLPPLVEFPNETP